MDLTATSAEATSSWNNLAAMISHLIEANPIQGLVTIFITTSIFSILFLLVIYGASRMIRENKKPQRPSFIRDHFVQNVLRVNEQMNLLMAKGRELAEKHQRIRDYMIIRDQMIVVDNTLDSIESKLVIEFAEKLRSLKGVEFETPSDLPVYRVFSNAISFSLNEYRKIFRRVAKENHLSDRSDYDFRHYVDSKLDTMKSVGRRAFESMYSSNTVPADQVMASFDRNWALLFDGYRGTFEVMRDISTKYENQIRKEEAEFETEWKNFTSNLLKTLEDGIEEKAK